MNLPPGRSRDPAMMPGLTLNTGVAAATAAPQPPATSASTTTTSNTNTSILPPPPPASSSAPTSITPVPPPPIPYTSTSNLSQNRNHTKTQIQTQTPSQNQTQNHATSRSSSPVRPTYSPITPPLNPTTVAAAAAAAAAAPFPSQRPTYTYNAHVDTSSAVAPPRSEPIDFDSNPDVLALKSAISILQMQRRKAEADMAALGRVKSAALAEPDAFVRDLTEGRVGVEGDRLFVGGVRVQDSDDASDEDSDSSTSGDEGEGAGEKGGGKNGAETSGGVTHTTDFGGGGGGDEILKMTTTARPPKAESESKAAVKTNPDPMDITGGGAGGAGPPKPWTRLPKPQNVVRCPPINWSQYAVVGESLDKLHSEQMSRPAQGTPAVVTADGRFEFRDGASGGLGRQERLVGVAAPYTPGNDRLLDKKPKGPKR
ncbi:hypothetical protein F5X99DRAFT_381543 [Biscogniauxia marginata]|nr:hypothetical protein F5X99DRAFT_381543 [Biscogniauxia marginata]